MSWYIASQEASLSREFTGAWDSVECSLRSEASRSTSVNQVVRSLVQTSDQ